MVGRRAEPQGDAWWALAISWRRPAGTREGIGGYGRKFTLMVIRVSTGTPWSSVGS